MNDAVGHRLAADMHVWAEGEDLHVVVRLEETLLGVVTRARRNADAGVRHRDGRHLPLQLAFAEVDADAGHVGCRFTKRVVVGVHRDGRARAQDATGALGEDVGRHARGPDPEHAAAPGALAHPLAGADRATALAPRCRVRCLEVVRGSAVAGEELDGLYPSLLIQLERDALLGKEVRALCRHVDPVECQYVVRFAQGPAFGKGRCRRQVGGVALGRAARGPACDRRDLFGGEGEVIAKHDVLRLGAPGRHVAVLDRPRHAARPGAGLPVGEQGHGRRLVRAVTLHTLLEQDGRHVAAEGRRVGRAGCRRCEQDGAGDQRRERV